MELIWRVASFPQLLDVSLVALKQSVALSMYETASFFFCRPLQRFCPWTEQVEQLQVARHPRRTYIISGWMSPGVLKPADSY